MTDERSGTLKDLQDLDLRLERTRTKIDDFDRLLDEVEAPALALEAEAQTLKDRLKEMKVEERRLERSADDRRARSRLLQERLKSVRNLREEAAAQAELDILRRALEGDEQEALTLLDQIKKMETRLQELEEARDRARSEVEPRRRELEEGQTVARRELEELQSRRDAFAATVPARELMTYQRIRGGGRSVAVATLTPDGACGQCFNLVPLQVQNEIRDGKVLVHCEACGVLLTAGEETP